MLLVVDNGSIFTRNLSDFLTSQNTDFKLFRFDEIDLHTIDRYDAFILSGRRNNDKQMNSFNSKIIRYCVDRSQKLLGICYGAELLVLTLGGTIRRMKQLQQGNQIIEVTAHNPLIDSSSSSIEAYESHRYELSHLGKDIVSIGTSAQCQHEIIQYQNNNIFGTQFHPEMTSDGHSLITNFLDL